MIEIGDRLLMASSLISFRRIEGFVGDDLQYSILINEGPLPADRCLYEDTLISFDTEKERNEEWVNMKQILTQDANVQILER